MKLFVELPPGDTRALPDDPRIAARPAVLPLDDAAHRDRLERFIAAHPDAPWVECGDPPTVYRVARAGGWPWLRGLEAGGPCGDTGAVVLVRAAFQAGRPWTIQGLGRRGMAAALALGAHGVQVDVHTWALADSPLHPEHLQRVRRSTARSTTCRDGYRRVGPPVLTHWPSHPDSGLPAPTSIGDATEGPPLRHWLLQFLDELEERVAGCVDAPLLADPFGTGTPIVQGPMANVSETDHFAKAIRDAGALPFCALGARRPDEARTMLHRMGAVEEPWGAGVIGFDLLPHRHAHIEAVRDTGRRPVILAGASPKLALRLQGEGLDPWLHTPSPRLARMALERGVDALVFEGCEAGGHVGQLPSAALWEEAIALFETWPSPSLLVLAGGIGDAPSAAFAGAMASGAARAGHRVGFQVGTAFLFTHEAVESGAITPTYQQRALAVEHTLCVGETVGLPLRCAPNRWATRAVEQEHRWKEEGLPLDERRSLVEHNNLGRTRLAARGIIRDGQGGYRTLPVAEQIEEGAFTLGQGATVERAVMRVDALVRSLTVGARRLLESSTDHADSFGDPDAVWIAISPPPEPHRKGAKLATPTDLDLAIVGLGCVLPGSPDVTTFWERCLLGMNSITAIPEERWLYHRYFHPDPHHHPTTTYVRMAGVVHDPPFDAPRFGIPPAVVPSLDRAQRLALLAAEQAVRGLDLGDRSRVAVLIGNSMGGEHAKSLAVRIRFREILAALGYDGDEALERAIHDRLEGTLPPVDVESMSGLLGNVIAGRIASWLDLGGGNATFDAACASSLQALVAAADALRSGRCDVVLTGGVDADLSPETFVGFCRTRALSPTGSQPFSNRADGFVMGEGAVILALKRLSDARRDGDRIFATIRGIGQSSDGRSTGITAPRVSGQLLAIRRALSDGGVDPVSVGMIEAHGTGTALGDRTELRALRQVYPKASLGSIKSQLGHLKGAAGAAGLLKAALALHHGVVPPTLNAYPLHPDVADGPFVLPRTAHVLEAPCAAVSAFGFGGTDYHAILGTADRVATPLHFPPHRWGPDPLPQLRCFGASDRVELAERVDRGWSCTPEEAAARPYRAIVLGEAPGLADWIRAGGRGAFGTVARVGEGAPEPVVAVFPGQGSPRSGTSATLMQIPLARRVLLELDAPELATDADPHAQHRLLVASGAAYAALLRTLPLTGALGHSVGELSALCCAGRLKPADALALAEARGRALEACPPGAMLAVQGPPMEVDGCALAAVNAPDAWVLAGPYGAIEAAATRLRAAGRRCTALDVERAFHSPAVQPAADALAEALAGVTIHSGLPWWSNRPAPDPHPDEDAVRQALVRGVTETVHFLDSVRSAYAFGARLFVQAGPGAALARHVERTLPDARVIALHPRRDPLGRDLVHAAAALVAEGYPQLLRALPGTWVQVGFPREVPARPPPSGETWVPTTLPHEVHGDGEGHGVDRSEDAPPATPTHDRSRRGRAEAIVLDAIGEVTGYPPAALPREARLDADLGIDSIRKLEILGLIQEQLPQPLDEPALARAEGLHLGALIERVEEALARPPCPYEEEPREAALWQLLGREPLPPGWTPDHLEATLRRWLDEGLPERCPDDPGAAAFWRVARAEDGHPVSTPLHGAPLRLTEGLPVRPVIFATGGTTGILVPCLRALPGARGVVVGRRPRGEAPPGFHYVPCDLTDVDAVRRAVAICRERYGRIEMVIHAAGSLRDRPVAALEPADLAAVLRPKLHGALHLFDATAEDAPELYVAFSSVAATLPNPGQAVYAAANAALERLHHPTAARSVALAWTAWSGRGMAADPPVQRRLRAAGIRPVDPELGATLFARAIRASGTVWIAHRPPPSPPPWPLGDPLPDGWTIPLDPTDPVLADHVVAGRPLVPAALWLAAAARIVARRSATPLRLQVLAPSPVNRPTRAVVREDDASLTVWYGETVVAQISKLEPSPLPEPPPPPGAATPFSYGGTLFHGPSWQLLARVTVEMDRASAVLRPSPASLDPVAASVDALFQLLALWAAERGRGRVLPVGIDRWAPLRPGDPRQIRIVPRNTSRGVVADGWVFDGNHEPLAVALGLREESVDG